MVNKMYYCEKLYATGKYNKITLNDDYQPAIGQANALSSPSYQKVSVHPGVPCVHSKGNPFRKTDNNFHALVPTQKLRGQMLLFATHRAAHKDQLRSHLRARHDICPNLYTTRFSEPKILVDIRRS